MKHRMGILKKLVILFLITSVSPTVFSQTNEEQAIKITALNYIEGWYSADTARMAKALSPDLKKRGFVVDAQTNQVKINEASYAQMIEWTGKRSNELKQNQALKIEVILIEIGKHIAMVKTITPQFIDYIHMGKINGVWKIYNVVWEPNNFVL